MSRRDEAYALAFISTTSLKVTEMLVCSISAGDYAGTPKGFAVEIASAPSFDMLYQLLSAPAYRWCLPMFNYWVRAKIENLIHEQAREE